MFPLCAQLGRCHLTCISDEPFPLKDFLRFRIAGRGPPRLRLIPVVLLWAESHSCSQLPTSRMCPVSYAFCLGAFLDAARTCPNCTKVQKHRVKDPGGNHLPAGKGSFFGRRFQGGSPLTSQRSGSMEPLLAPVVILMMDIYLSSQIFLHLIPTLRNHFPNKCLHQSLISGSAIREPNS